MYAEWLNRYIEEQGGVEDVGWHAFLTGMLRAPPEDIIVKKLIKSPRGGSGNNPYLADRYFKLAVYLALLTGGNRNSVE